MIVADFNIKSVTILKPKADSPLVINRNGMLSFTIIGKPVQLISWRNLEIIKTCGQIDVFQFP
jgi:hypothetical protein